MGANQNQNRQTHNHAIIVLWVWQKHQYAIIILWVWHTHQHAITRDFDRHMIMLSSSWLKLSSTATSACYYHLVSSTDTSACHHHVLSLTDTSACYHHVVTQNFTPPKRRFWKAEPTFPNVSSKHFSRAWELDFGYESLKSAWRTHSKRLARPSNIFVWGA